MNENNGPYRLRQLRNRYLATRVVETLCWSLAVAVLAWTALQFLPMSFAQRAGVAAAAFASGFTLIFFLIRLNKVNLPAMARWIDFNYPQLENSTDLLLADASALRKLERLQYEKVSSSLETVYPRVTFPHRLPGAAALFIASVAVLLVAKGKGDPESKAITARHGVIEKPTGKPLRPGITSFKIVVDPPAYTAIPGTILETPDMSLPEGSLVSWQITFDQHIREGEIVIGNRDTLKMKSTGNAFTCHAKFTSPAFYQIRWRSRDDSTSVSDYYGIEVVPDRAPEIKTRNLNQFTELGINDNPVVPVTASIYDDYGITDGYLVATVAKGSGESVKFREERLRFDSPAKLSGKKLTASHKIDLRLLGLEPGDELYFYVIAFDNRYPRPNVSRTETFFITLADTASVEFGFDSSLGVDLMPEYFRSQRQIIIDSEKLLKEKGRIGREQFNFRSNELAHDQKVLRLRYGQFLGEEFESGMVEEEVDAHHHHDDAEASEGQQEIDVTKEFGHVHDGDNEHNLVQDRDHAHSDGEDEKKDPLEGFVHRHDDPEEATFFTQSIRTKLKATLSIMWDAELHLRLSDPTKSLPYQYRALKLLKEISNDSRIYVHRTGFDAPPLKEDRRLTGELDEARGSRDQYSSLKKRRFTPVREALALIEEKLYQENPEFTPADKNVLHQAGEIVAAVADESPGAYLETLSALQRLIRDGSSSPDLKSELTKVRESLLGLIPSQPERITPGKTGHHRLDSLFLKNLYHQ